MSIEFRIINVLRKVFPEANEESNVDNIEGWDSLNHLRCLLSLEEEFAVAFTPEEMEKMTSVKAMVAVINNTLSTK